jgi:dolichol-phosphate mannosyltransferase
MERKVLIVIPTYNERENVPKLIEKIFSINPLVHILFIDDNSPDGTGIFLDSCAQNDSRIKVIHRESKLGLGSAYKVGFRYAIQHNYKIVFEMDADFSHDPEEINNFLKEVKNFDLIIGSRYLNQVTVVNWPLSRLLLSYFANLYARIITGIPVKDLTSGFKCYRIEVIKALPLHRILSEGYGFQIETVFWTHLKGFKIKEIPIIFTDRIEGTSKMSKKIVWEAFWTVWRLKFVGILHRYG